MQRKASVSVPRGGAGVQGRGDDVHSESVQPTPMISCHRSHLEARCTERGYTLDEVLPCVVSQDGDEWTIDVEHEAYPRVSRLQEPPAVPGLARTDAPGFLTKVKNFASAAVSHVAAGMPMASDTEIIRRHDICLTCEHLVNDACNLCGCPVSRAAGYVSKLSWADQACPAGKWGKVTPDSAASGSVSD